MSNVVNGTTALTAAVQAIEAARRGGASDTEAWVSTGHSSEVRVRDGKVDERIDAETGTLVLRVFVGSRTATSTTTDLYPDGLTRLAEETVALAKLADPDPCAGLPDGPFPPAIDGGSLELVDPALVDPAPDLLLTLAHQADAAARGLDPRVRSGEGATATRWAGTLALANSRGMTASYDATTCSLWASAAADDAGGKKREGWWYAADRRLAGMEDAETIGRTAAERTRRQLGARPVPTQEVPVVWAPEAARSFLSILARAAAGNARYRGRSFLIDREGEHLASPLVSISDDATLPGRLGSRPFDAEGVVSQRTPLIAGGVFTGFLYDAYSARKAGQRGTANAGRSSFPGAGSRIEVEPSNLVMSPGGEQTGGDHRWGGVWALPDRHARLRREPHHWGLLAWGRRVLDRARGTDVPGWRDQHRGAVAGDAGWHRRRGQRPDVRRDRRGAHLPHFPYDGQWSLSPSVLFSTKAARLRLLNDGPAIAEDPGVGCIFQAQGIGLAANADPWEDSFARVVTWFSAPVDKSQVNSSVASTTRLPRTFSHHFAEASFTTRGGPLVFGSSSNRVTMT